MRLVNGISASVVYLGFFCAYAEPKCHLQGIIGQQVSMKKVSAPGNARAIWCILGAGGVPVWMKSLTSSTWTVQGASLLEGDVVAYAEGLFRVEFRLVKTVHFASCDARNGCSVLPYFASNADRYCIRRDIQSLQMHLPHPSVFFYCEMRLQLKHQTRNDQSAEVDTEK